MNENLNLVEILKYVPFRTMLWSPVFGDCAFITIDLTDVIYPIKCQITTTDRKTTYVGFTKDGRLDIQYENCGCVLFPSKWNMDWSTFRITKEDKRFEPFQKNIDKGINSNGFVYVDLDLPSGTKWARMNVGAYKPSDFGLYFQWGDTQGYTKNQVGKDKQFSSNLTDYKFGMNSCFAKYVTKGTTLDLEDDAAHVHMGGDWHMPTSNQIQELVDNTINTWTTQDGVNGRLFTSKKDSSKFIFIPAAGFACDGSVHDSRDSGFVWSSMLGTSYVGYGKDLGLDSGFAYFGYGNRFNGNSVRGVIG